MAWDTPPASQVDLARNHGLPENFNRFAGDPQVDGPWPDHLADLLASRRATRLNQFLAFAVGEQSAESLFLLIALDALQAQSPQERPLLSARMRKAFDPQGDLAPNLSALNRTLLHSALDNPTDESLAALQQVKRNLMETASDAYRRFRLTPDRSTR
ncbi:hypothetical protein JI739_03560 [Ramlibacter sp. AW1]|uniref:Uncharacterized protein n=1 Tax=Ramlibacter aurantiacus TaxID=2801330 RepID=A0A936ZLD3_9BURK|nr:hypothetical protein [Ramlibacter aurantiacus]MBL0419418.1 hypothetical protein [Ramlibacter aurantiacus]